jgi:hypothetical protein
MPTAVGNHIQGRVEVLGGLNFEPRLQPRDVSGDRFIRRYPPEGLSSRGYRGRRALGK